MVSIKDIAAACGVSIATVSKALNGHKDVSENTAKLVREKAKELGYMPNSQARALKTNRTYNIGVLFVEESDSGLRQSYFASVLDSFKREAEKNGFDITFISGNIGDNSMTFYEHCIYRNVEGVMMACVRNYNDPMVTELLESRVPVVTLDYSSGKAFSVVSDNYSGMKLLTEHIISKGHRNIAYICGEDSFVTQERIRGYKDALRAADIEFRNELLVRAKYHDSGLTELKVKEMLSERINDRPSCIIVPDDFAALGAYNAAEQLGMSVPDDISFAGYDGIEIADACRPKLTTIRQDTDMLGRQAAIKLISVIKQEEAADYTPLYISGSLLEGRSVKGST